MLSTAPQLPLDLAYSAKARVAGAGALLRPVTSSTQVVMKHAQSVAEAVARTRSSLSSSWSSMTACRRNVGTLPNSKSENLVEASLASKRSESLLTEEVLIRDPMLNNYEPSVSSGGSSHDDTDEEELLIPANQYIPTSTVDSITEGELWYQLEKELQKRDNTPNIHAQEEEAAAAKEITEEENQLVDVTESSNPVMSDNMDNHRFYLPGRIVHIVSVPCLSDDSNSNTDIRKSVT